MLGHSKGWFNALKAVGLPVAASDELVASAQIVLYAKVNTPLGLYDAVVVFDVDGEDDPRSPGFYHTAASVFVRGFSDWLGKQH